MVDVLVVVHVDDDPSERAGELEGRAVVADGAAAIETDVEPGERDQGEERMVGRHRTDVVAVDRQRARAVPADALHAEFEIVPAGLDRPAGADHVMRAADVQIVDEQSVVDVQLYPLVASPWAIRTPSTDTAASGISTSATMR